MESALEVPVVIFGAGPAGCSAALKLDMLGIPFALIDHAVFPRDKVCGDGIPLKAITLLEQLDIKKEEIVTIAHPIHQMIIHAPNQKVLKSRVVQDFEKSGFCCARISFDELLFNRAKQKARHVFTPAHLKKLEPQEDGYALEIMFQSQTVLIRTRLIIGADGANSLISKVLSLLNQRKNFLIYGIRQYYKGTQFGSKVHIIYDRSILPGYFWVFPISANSSNVGMMVYEHRHLLDNSFYNGIQQNSVLRRLLKDAEPLSKAKKSLLPSGLTPGKRTTKNALLIGDAAAFVNPLTGGGIYNAMLSGMKAALIAHTAFKENDFSESVLGLYDRWWQSEFLPGFYLAAFVLKWLQTEQRINWFFTLAQHNPILRQIFFMSYGQVLPKILKKFIKK